MHVKTLLATLLILSSLLDAKPLPLFFEGNEQLDDRQLYSALGLHLPYFYEFWKSGPAIDPKTLKIIRTTIKNFYRVNGFFHADITSKDDNDSISLVIKEKRAMTIADISTISKLDITTKIPFDLNNTFDAQKFTESKGAIKLFYADNGYCNAQLDAKSWIDIETDLAYMLYEVIPNEICHFGPVSISSPQSIKPEVIDSFLNFKEGDRYSPERIRQSYNNLYGQEGIAKAIIDTSKKYEATIPTDITITEYKDLRRFTGGGGFSSDEGVTLLAGIKHRNFFGDLKTISLEARYTQIKQTIRGNFDMPLSNRNTFGADATLENERFNGFQERRLIETLYLKQNRTPNSFQESLIFDHTLTYDSDDLNTFPEGALFIISPRLQWVHDVRDKILDPSNGYFIRTELQGSLKSKISDASYYKFFISSGYIQPLESAIAALRVNYGSLRRFQGEVPASYRFYAGGMNSNRAYGYRQLGPTNINGDPIGSDSLMETTLEYRFPISGDLRGVVFNDNSFIGNSYVPDYQKGYYSAGLGLRYVTPIGPLAFDLGFDIAHPTEEFALHFHVGELF